jgi:hypothetical protein
MILTKVREKWIQKRDIKPNYRIISQTNLLNNINKGDNLYIHNVRKVIID